MRALLSIAVLMSVTFPAFAEVGFVPEPETLSLLAIGVTALLLSRRNKK